MLTLGCWVGDEKKPRCQNCIDKDLVCQYGLQVSFLEKNTFTVSAQELQGPRDHVAYKRIQVGFLYNCVGRC